jgi:GTP cyclohydrolase I
VEAAQSAYNSDLRGYDFCNDRDRRMANKNSKHSSPSGAQRNGHHEKNGIAVRRRVQIDVQAALDPPNVSEPRPLKIDVERVERAMREILIAVGENPDREGLKKTPARVARVYAELLAGMGTDPRRHLKTVFHERYDEVVLLRDIEFHSLCEHHLLPFTGRAHVAYLPNGKVVGLSKLARLVEEYARRLQVQERLTTQIADALMEELNPIGAACVIEATHTCMTIRGPKKHGSVMVTSALRGIFKENASSRSEILALMHGGRDGRR